MTVNRKAAALTLAALLAIPAEGLRQYAYYDPPGILSVCYGSTSNVIAGKMYGIEECRDRLDVDMKAAIDNVDRCAPGLPESVLAAFADAVYNMGPAIACDRKNSTAARLLEKGEIRGACNQLLRWDKAHIAGVAVSLPGLTKRRRAELNLCLKGAV